jgi:hypothetical protein
VGRSAIVAEVAGGAEEGNWYFASIWIERVKEGQPAFYCITRPGSGCEVPPAPGQLPVPTLPPPLSPEEEAKRTRLMKDLGERFWDLVSIAYRLPGLALMFFNTCIVQGLSTPDCLDFFEPLLPPPTPG